MLQEKLAVLCGRGLSVTNCLKQYGNRQVGFWNTVRRPFSGYSPQETFHAAVVGSGPAGMYTVQCLLKTYGDNLKVSLLDRLPTPFGLVRSGVAPDHAETKNVVNQFNRVISDPRVEYFGNVEVGRHVSLSEIQDVNHAVVLTYGTEQDRRLGIPGEGLPGVYSARDFVWWFNGHPDCAGIPVDLSRVRSVAILGLGNVALDCARILLQSPSGPLASTDISEGALSALRRSAVESVHIIGRRGIAQAQFTGKELRELLFEVPGVRTEADPEQVKLSDADRMEVAGSRKRQRAFDLISKAVGGGSPCGGKGKGGGGGGGCGGSHRSGGSGRRPEGDGRERVLRFHFLRSPVEIVAGGDGSAAAVRLEKNVLTGGGPGEEQRAKGTGEMEDLPADLVLTCIGYRALPMEGAPFDEKRGLIPNTHGRIEGMPGLYAGGWVARGPSGKIGCNLADANDVVEAIEQDRSKGLLVRRGSEGLDELLSRKGVRFVGSEEWQRIDCAEIAAGTERGKVREKFVHIEEMLSAASAS